MHGCRGRGEVESGVLSPWGGMAVPFDIRAAAGCVGGCAVRRRSVRRLVLDGEGVAGVWSVPAGSRARRPCPPPPNLPTGFGKKKFRQNN